MSVDSDRRASLGRQARASGRCGVLLGRANSWASTVSVTQTGERAWAGRPGRVGRCGSSWVTRTLAGSVSTGMAGHVTAGRALVLGGGGLSGIAWETGVLAGLAAGGADVTTADYVLGTSAGATVAAQLGSGLPLTELLDRQTVPERQSAELIPDTGAGRRAHGVLGEAAGAVPGPGRAAPRDRRAGPPGRDPARSRAACGDRRAPAAALLAVPQARRGRGRGAHRGRPRVRQGLRCGSGQRGDGQLRDPGYLAPGHYRPGPLHRRRHPLRRQRRPGRRLSAGPDPGPDGRPVTGGAGRRADPGRGSRGRPGTGARAR